MSAATATKSTPSKPKKDREKEKREKAPAGTERLKTIVRRLPPNLPEEVFWTSVSAWVKGDTVTWKSFCAGKVAKRINKENVPSRAYIAFKTEDQVLDFSRGYDGHIFRDKAGHESQAIVEFAPFQKIPAEKKKVDARMGTIEKDEDFISFMSALNAESSAEPVSLESLIAANQPPPQPKTTPLLEALKAEKAAAKEKEAIQRNHVHYKDQQVTILASRKDDLKKKGNAAQKAPEPVAPLSKKAQKKAAAAAAASGQPSGQKATTSATTPSSSKNAEATKPTPGPSNAPAKSQKPSKSQRQKAKNNAAATPAPTATPAAPANPPALAIATAPPPPSTTAAPSSAPTASGSAPAPPAVRRTRPVIGIGRQFEAALSGAGVGTERKPRRPREADKPATTDSAAAQSSAPGPAASSSGDTKIPPTSPKRDRPVKPTALDNFARIDDPSTQTTTPAADDAKTASGSGGNSSRGSRRGRGRGRGGTTTARGGVPPVHT